MSDPNTSPSTAPPASPASKPKPRRKRLVKLLLGLVALVLLLVWFAPTIIAKTALRNRLARGATAKLNGDVNIGGASLGWLSPIELRDVTITDTKGRVVARIPKVTSSKSLLALARSQDELGEFTLHSPAVEVICENRSTNIEDVLRRYTEDDASARSRTRPAVIVILAGGTLTIRDVVSRPAGAITDVDARVVISANRAEPIQITLAAHAPGRLEAELSVSSSGRAKLVASGVAIDSLVPLLSHFEPELTLAGSLTAELTATWSNETATVEGTIGAKNLSVTAPWLNGDTLRLSAADLKLKAARNGQVFRIDHSDLTTDVAKVSASGAFNPGEPIEKFFERPGAKLDATIDIARLAAKLPKLLRIRGGTEVREGRLVVKVESTAGAEGARWAGTVNTSALKALRDGRAVNWPEPLAIEFDGRYLAGKLPMFDKLTCKSGFIAINAQVSPDSVRAAANFYLDRLAARLGEFIDLGGTNLDGRGTAMLVASRTPSGEFKLDGSLDLQQFAFTSRSGRALNEPSLKLTFEAAGTARDSQPASVSTASATLIAADDELRVTLKEPIADLKKLASGALDAHMKGGLGRWWTRVGAFVKLPRSYVLAGAADAHGTIRFAENTVAVDRLSLAIDNVRFRGAGVDLAEPRMSAIADLTVDYKRGKTSFEKFTIQSNPLSVTEGRLIIDSPDAGEVTVEGDGPAEVGLNRLGRTLKLYADPQGPDSLRGRGTGPIRFRYSAGVTAFGGTLDFTNFSMGPPADPDWSEPALKLVLDASYTEATESLAFAVAKLDRPGFALDAAGSFANLTTTADVNLAGKLTYDLAKLTPKLRELLGGAFAGQGRDTTPFSLVGALAPRPPAGSNQPPGNFAQLKGELRLGWDSLHAYGFDVGRGELNAKLADGVCRVNPIAATFGGGKVNIHPTLRLDPEPSEITLKGGTIVDHAKLTPAVCAQALGFALPAIANTGQAEGEISILLGENRILLASAEKTLVKGRIVIHKATVAPGPVVGEIAKLLGASNIALTIAKETTVPVRVENGRVHHQNLALSFGGHTIVTSGSVGFDSSLDLVADVPIPPGLLKNSPIAAKALAGKRVKVPIKGTLQKPMLDPRQFQIAIAKLAQEAARDVGKELLNKELDKLFPGMPRPKKGG